MTERDLRGLHLHFDCAGAGTAGDMTIGALLDAGVPRSVVEDAIEALGVERSRLRVAEAIKGGIRATNVTVDVGPAHAHEHAHEHEHEHEHAHVAVRDIVARIQAAPLADPARRLAVDIFDRIARAEGALHGVAPADVELHEIGALDSIVDIVGAAAAIAWLEPVAVSCSAVAMGTGTVKSAHGRLPVPSPAALAILTEAGAPTTGGGVARELCTPTGAAILAATVTRWGDFPAIAPRSIGYGAGDADLADRPNVMRVVLGAPTVPAVATATEVVCIEANIDDMTPELCGHAADAIARAGAIDVWWTPVTMKKSRPAFVLAALAAPGDVEPVIGAILRETTTLGVRLSPMARRVLDREIVMVDTDLGPVPVKVARFSGEIVNVAPEYEACRELAERVGVPLKRVMAAAIAGWEIGHRSRPR